MEDKFCSSVQMTKYTCLRQGLCFGFDREKRDENDFIISTTTCIALALDTMGALGRITPVVPHESMVHICAVDLQDKDHVGVCTLLIDMTHHA
jgi:hypothetical protein